MTANPASSPANAIATVVAASPASIDLISEPHAFSASPLPGLVACRRYTHWTSSPVAGLRHVTRGSSWSLRSPSEVAMPAQAAHIDRALALVSWPPLAPAPHPAALFRMAWPMLTSCPPAA
jgi:hypothetical protein